ncbi:hypothetical protein QUA62_06760 [Microcoleus sp. MON1_C1]
MNSRESGIAALTRLWRLQEWMRPSATVGNQASIAHTPIDRT